MTIFRKLSCLALSLPLIALAESPVEPEKLADVEGSGYEAIMYRAIGDSDREPIGSITIRETSDGTVRFIPDVKGLPPGEHGFHIHRFDRCQPNRNDEGKLVIGEEAGQHWDPEETGRHEGPTGNGHLGDLPVLTVDKQGRATAGVDASRLRLKDIAGRALIIHAGGDNYSDIPKPNGGGGDRIACGVIKTGPLFRPQE